jgi:endonuclease/exonuclease/phosphatase family metal-dependent hydrolase
MRSIHFLFHRYSKGNSMKHISLMRRMRIVCVGVLFVCLSSFVFAQSVLSIRDARALPLGSTITVAGRVTVSGEFGSQLMFMQDGTAGIAINPIASIGRNDRFVMNINTGDSVIITGRLAEIQAVANTPGSGILAIQALTTVNGQTTSVISVQRVGTTSVLPAPRVLTSINDLNESIESQYVEVPNVRLTNATVPFFRAAANFSILGTTSPIILRFDRFTSIANLPVFTDARTVRGIVNHFQGTYQLQPRSAEDIGAGNVPALSARNAPNRVKFTTWNVRWFGDPNSGSTPSTTNTTFLGDSTIQINSAIRVLDSIDADVYALQEIVIPTTATFSTAFNRILAALPRYGGVIATEITSRLTQKVAFLYKRTTIDTIRTALLTQLEWDPTNPRTAAYATGRYPFEMQFRLRGVGVSSDTLVAVSYHARSQTGTDTNDYNNRTRDAQALYNYLRSPSRSNAGVVVLGDFNDRVTGTILASRTASPYAQFVNDWQNFQVVTAPLERAGNSSFTNNTSMIDHVIMSRRLFVGVQNETSSFPPFLERPQAYIPKFTVAVSDHFPVSAFLRTDVTYTSVRNQLPYARLSVSPNPARDAALLSFVPDEQSDVQIILTDLLGNQRYATVVPAQTVTAQREMMVDIRTENLVSGLYLVRIEQRGRYASVPLHIVR